MNSLELKKIWYKYAKTDVFILKGISHYFIEEKMYAITGASGSGKSTLLYLMGGIESPSVGEILFNGKAVLDLNEYRRNSVSMVNQSFLLFPRKTVIENVMYPMEIKHEQNSRVQAEKYLAMLNIKEDLFQRFPKNLSGGEQQRVAIARSLAAKSRILLADEPTGNLDDENALTVIQTLKQIAHENNKIVIITTHDKRVCTESDIILHLKDGQLQ